MERSRDRYDMPIRDSSPHQHMNNRQHPVTLIDSPRESNSNRNNRGDRFRQSSRSPSRRHTNHSVTQSGSCEPAGRLPPRRRSRSPPSRLKDTGRESRRNIHRSRSRSRSPKPHGPLRGGSRSRTALPSQDESFNDQLSVTDGTAVRPLDKQRPNFKATGLLAAETNKVTVGSGQKAESIILKYHEPPEARKPPSSEQWNLYVFKGNSGDPLKTIPLYTRSCWLVGREDAVADIPVEHPSCSKQHAVFQFRHVTKKDEWGQKKSKVNLYLIDLESANGTKLNSKVVETARYVECRTGDIIQLGQSDREYVLILPPKAQAGP